MKEAAEKAIKEIRSYGFEVQTCIRHERICQDIDTVVCACISQILRSDRVHACWLCVCRFWYSRCGVILAVVYSRLCWVELCLPLDIPRTHYLHGSVGVGRLDIGHTLLQYMHLQFTAPLSIFRAS